eukprot:TRINITY_DN2723_c0_g1_i1.p1 TRINITY_DN2723_c0_g1~~TRINITY_DN2723_c0_g1_i1.p1  ORF type:complete len:327 (-),score=43.45 TRINITY_DN2723_c0_g1_i1:152-1036(-)
MAKVLAAPTQESITATIGIHVEETVFVDFPDEAGKEHFVKDHLDLGKLLQMMCCPICCLYVPWAGKKNKMEYYRECGLCKCPYAVKLNEKHVGKVHDVRCCDNGCMFCCCPILTCGGHAKIMGMDGQEGLEKFVFAKSLFPCWPLVQACAMVCAPLGFCCVGMDGCCNYCKGSEFKSITQPVYKGPWKRSDGTEPEKIGEFTTTQRFNPVCCCCAVGTPLKYYFRPTNEIGQKLVNDELAALSLVLQLYRGMPVPCAQCSPAGFQMPYGIPCLDIGLGTRTSWRSVQEVMKDSD